jgi:aminoglycoside phosphotransferase (APT) family kinase protein
LNSPDNFTLLDDYMRKTAAGLAALHKSGVTTGRSWTWEDELDEVRDRIERLGAAIPSLTHAADPLLERLKEMASSTPADLPVPTHGSYRPAQVLLYRGQIGFIDFDSFCQAEPAHDLALFLSTVKNIGLDTTEIEDNKRALPLEEPERTERLKQMIAICDAFLEEYERHAPVSRQRIALWEALDQMMLVLASWIKIKTFRLQDTCGIPVANHGIYLFIAQDGCSRNPVGTNGYRGSAATAEGAINSQRRPRRDHLLALECQARPVVSQTR